MPEAEVIEVLTDSTTPEVVEVIENDFTEVVEVVDAGPAGPSGDSTSFSFSKPGILDAPFASPFRFYAPFDCTLEAVLTSVGSVPTGDSVILDVLKNGASIYSSGVGRPSIAPNADFGVGTSGNPQAAVFLSGTDYITIAIDQVGSIFPGANLLVLINLQRS